MCNWVRFYNARVAKEVKKIDASKCRDRMMTVIIGLQQIYIIIFSSKCGSGGCGTVSCAQNMSVSTMHLKGHKYIF